MTEQWVRDWPAFVAMIERLLREGATCETLQITFGSRKVIWSGQVDMIDLDEISPDIGLKMPCIRVDFGCGQKDDVDGLVLPVADGAIGDWKSVRLGDRVLFEATLGAGDAPFPPVEVDTYESGKKILMIRVTDGRLVRVLDD